MGGSEEQMLKKLSIFFQYIRRNLYKGKKEALCQPRPQLQVMRNHTLMKYYSLASITFNS